MYVLSHSHDELVLHSLECYFGVYLVSAETVHHSSTYIILYQLDAGLTNIA